MGQGLSADECRLLGQVVAGSDLEEIAQGFNVSRADALAWITSTLRRIAHRFEDSQPDTVPSAPTPPTIDPWCGHHGLMRNRRRDSRIRVRETCRAVSDNGTFDDDAVLVDLSRSGARLRLSRPLRHGQTILIQRTNGHVHAGQVVWIGNDEVGLQFTDNAPADGVEIAVAHQQST